MDREKLSKLMAMTTSENDHEALAALRLANKMLTAEKATWSEVLAGAAPGFRLTIQRTPYHAEESWVAPHLKDTVMVDLMFRTIYTQPRTGNELFWQTMDGIHQWWKDKGQLSQRQYDAIKNAYRRLVPSRDKSV